MRNRLEEIRRGFGMGKRTRGRKKNGGERGREGVRKKGKKPKKSRREKKARKERNLILDLKFKWCYSRLIKNVYILSSGAHC